VHQAGAERRRKPRVSQNAGTATPPALFGIPMGVGWLAAMRTLVML
jgi:hypothetical protein